MADGGFRPAVGLAALREAGRWSGITSPSPTPRGGSPRRPPRGAALVRGDAGFHEHRAFEDGSRQADVRDAADEHRAVLVAVARYLAAHFPTRREREGTFIIASRLHRGERVHGGGGGRDRRRLTATPVAGRRDGPLPGRPEFSKMITDAQRLTGESGNGPP